MHGKRKPLVISGYVAAVVLPMIGLIAACLVAQDQSRSGSRHAVRIAVLAIAAGAIYVTIYFTSR